MCYCLAGLDEKHGLTNAEMLSKMFDKHSIGKLNLKRFLERLLLNVELSQICYSLDKVLSEQKPLPCHAFDNID